MKKHKTAFNRLFKIAEAQQGFFTTQEAIDAGYPDNTHPYHVRSGNWVRESRGIYRLAHFPITDRPDLVRWYLWSRNREGQPQGVYSHETALSLHELSDAMPSKLHMIVPPDFRRSGEVPSVLVLHSLNLPSTDITAMSGFKVTKALRSVTDVVQAGTLSDEFVKQALKAGLQRGLIAQSEIKKVTGLSSTTKEKIEKFVNELKK